MGRQVALNEGVLKMVEKKRSSVEEKVLIG